MNDPRVSSLLRAALSGRLTRRQVLETGLGLGLATPVLAALVAAAPEASAAPTGSAAPRLARAQAGNSGSFTVLFIGGASDVDPQSSYITLGSAISLGAYEMLLRYKGNSTSEYEPMLAESWVASPDNSTYTFKLPANAKFHDGTVCDAAAVKASFTRFHKMQLGPFKVITRFVDDPDKQIEAVDATTLRFNLGKPQPLFLAAMASNYGPYVVSPKAVQDHKTDKDPWAHQWFAANAVGTGPYKLVENDVNTQSVLTKFDDYHRGWSGNHFDKIVFRIVPENATRRQLIEQGQADATTVNLTPEDVEALKRVATVDVLTYPSTRVNWVILNTVKLKTKEVRQGFSYAFPYDDVVNGVYKGLIKRSGPIPDTVKDSDPNVFLYKTDLAKAKQLILSGGFKEGDKFDYLLPSGDEVENSVAQLFQANVQKMGFKLEISQVDSATQNDIILGNSPADQKPAFMGAWAWFPDYNDPWNQLAPNFLKVSIGNGGSNAGAWVNDRFEAIMAEAEHYTDEKHLADLMKEAQNIVTEQDPPAIYYGQLLYYTIIQKNIQGFVPNPLYLECYPFYQMSRASS